MPNYIVIPDNTSLQRFDNMNEATDAAKNLLLSDANRVKTFLVVQVKQSISIVPKVTPVDNA